MWGMAPSLRMGSEDVRYKEVREISKDYEEKIFGR
jgi:hypothetical protein